jgi:integrase
VRAIIVVLWRAGLRAQEALALAEHDLDQRRGSILVRSGKGGRRRAVAPDSSRRRGKSTRRGWDGGLYAFMRRVLSSDRGSELYGKRQPMIEPVFANATFNRKLTRFHRRGSAAVRTEWRLITATHNLIKLHNHQLAAASA